MKKQFRNFTIQLFDPEKNGLAFFHLLQRNESRLEEFFPGTLAENRTLEDNRAYCASLGQRIKEKSYLSYLITDNTSGDLVGLVDVKSIRWNIPKGELGYFIDQDYTGQGITSEAVGIVVDYLVAEYGFKKLLCRVNEKNIGSIKVALNNNFELEGTIRNDHATSSGVVVDLNYYGRIF